MYKSILAGIAILFVVTTAGAQVNQPVTDVEPPPAPSPPLPPIITPVPVFVPLPPNGCVWAGRPFSNGAEFCFGKGVVMICESGSWKYDRNVGCDSASAVDTR